MKLLNFKQLERIDLQVNKMWKMLGLFATLIFSGALLNRILNLVGDLEIFDFDLSEDIDKDIS